MKKIVKKNRRPGKKLLAGLIVILIVAVAATVWAMEYHRTPAHPVTTGSSNLTPRPVATKGDGTTTSPTPPPSTSDQGGGSSATTPPPSPASSVKPAAPYGTFVSNHFPGQHGSPADSESSECVTTPDVSCSVSFTKDGVTKSLAAETTDNDGAAYWPTWSISQLGLTSGNWTVSATATSGDQTTTTTDQTALQVP